VLRGVVRVLTARCAHAAGLAARQAATPVVSALLLARLAPFLLPRGVSPGPPPAPPGTQLEPGVIVRARPAAAPPDPGAPRDP
jgi:hypothetical protein